MAVTPILLLILNSAFIRDPIGIANDIKRVTSMNHVCYEEDRDAWSYLRDLYGYCLSSGSIHYYNNDLICLTTTEKFPNRTLAIDRTQWELSYPEGYIVMKQGLEAPDQVLISCDMISRD